MFRGLVFGNLNSAISSVCQQGYKYFIVNAQEEDRMAGVNKAILIGNLGADPEVKYLTDGTTVANFRIATSEDRVNRTSGETTTNTEWHRVVAFGKLAEICGEYLKKGKQVYVEGRLRTRSWEDKDGNRKSRTEIVAYRMQMLGARGLPDEASDFEKEAALDQGEPPGSDDDVPF
jgi:single-strand DNA-binding protein